MLALLGVVVAFACQQPPPKDPVLDQIEEFHKFYRPTRNTHEKVEAIHVLEKLDREQAAELLLEACGDSEFPVREAALQVLAGFKSEEVKQLLRKAAADDKRTKVAQRSGAIQALGRIGDVEALSVLVANLKLNDFELKRASVVALGQLHQNAAAEPLVALLSDKEPALRTAALDALGTIRCPEKCVTEMLPLLQAPEWQVRASAINAVGKLRVKEAIQPLIESLGREEGRLREDALAALKGTTGFEYGDDATLWQKWWDGLKDRFQVPTDAEIAKRKAIQAQNNQQYQKQQNEFVGVPTKSKRIVFVIDVSGSMEELIAEPKNFKLKDRGYKSYTKIEIVKSELIRTVQALGPEVRFNLVTFATHVKPWKDALVGANIVNKAAAVKYIEDLKAIGGASQGFKARAGLSGSADISEGKTNTYGALMAALESGGGGAITSGPQKPGATYDKRYDSPVDTLFFLSDGTPSTGEYVEKDEILAEVRRVNSLRKLVIHTIAIGDMEHAFMQELAAQNGGTFTDLGK